MFLNYFVKQRNRRRAPVKTFLNIDITFKKFKKKEHTYVVSWLANSTGMVHKYIKNLYSDGCLKFEAKLEIHISVRAQLNRIFFPKITASYRW